jgi:hypothetical protein
VNTGECLNKGLSTFLSKLKAFPAFIKLSIKLIVNLSELLSLLLGLTVGAIIGVAFGELANVCLPA